MSSTTSNDRHRELLARLLFWGSPVLAAAIFISLAMLTQGPPLGHRRLTMILYVNGGLSFAGSAAGGLLMSRVLALRVAMSVVAGAFGSAAYLMLTLLADHVIPGF